VKLWLAVAALAGMAAGAEHGSQDRGCAPCHRKQFDSYYGKQEKPGNAMARALYSAGQVAAPAAGETLRYSLPPFTYTLERREGEREPCGGVRVRAGVRGPDVRI
jgi:hypothetical protein